MFYKVWPLYKDWVLIFGKDRATGENAEAFVDAVNDLVSQDKGETDMSAGGDYVLIMNATNNDENSKNMFTYGKNGATLSKGKKKMHKRPKIQYDDTEGRMVDLTSNFFDKAKSRMCELVHRIGFEHDASAMGKQVLEALSSIGYLTIEDKITDAKVVCGSMKNLDIFFCLTGLNKEVMVKMILDGKF